MGSILAEGPGTNSSLILKDGRVRNILRTWFPNSLGHSGSVDWGGLADGVLRHSGGEYFALRNDILLRPSAVPAEDQGSVLLPHGRSKPSLTLVPGYHMSSTGLCSAHTHTQARHVCT